MWSFPFFLSCLLCSKTLNFLLPWISLSCECVVIFSLTFFNFLILSALSYFTENKTLFIKSGVGLVRILIIVGMSFLCKNPILFLIMLEASVFPISFFILFLSKDEDKLISAIIIIIINLRGSLPFIAYSSWFIFSFEGSWVLLLNSCDSKLIFGMFIFVLCSKLPLAMFHFWLTKAHVAARACISIVLASILLKLGRFGIIKYIVMFLDTSLFLTENFVSLCIVFSILFCLNMLRYVDMKMLVAVSSILHIGIMLPLIRLRYSIGCLCIIFIMLGHGIVSYFLFMIVRVIYETSLRRSTHYNKSRDSFLRGLSLLIFALRFLNIGLPPLINFLREVGVCSTLLGYSLVRVIFFSATMLISIFFCIYMVTKRFFGRKNILFVQETESSLSRFRLIFFLILVLYPLFF